MRFSKKGFTLIELIVVVIIVAILAAVALPMMTANVKKAKRSEAVAACGSLRTAARLYQTENNQTLPTNRSDLISYIAAGDLNGTYYNNADYSISGTTIKAGTAGNGYGWVNMSVTTGEVTQGD